ncbi:hypothetical protein AAC387_Pa08g0584 [Persea americana]
MMVVVVMVSLLLVNNPLHVAKLGDVARDRNSALLLESILFFCNFEQLHEQWMVEVNHRHHEPLLLLPLAHHDRETTLWYVPRLLLAVVQQVQVREVEVEAEQVLVPAPHHKQQQQKQQKFEKLRNQEISRFGILGLWVSQELRKWPRVGSRNGQTEEIERRVKKRVRDVAHDRWLDVKKKIRIQNEEMIEREKEGDGGVL